MTTGAVSFGRYQTVQPPASSMATVPAFTVTVPPGCCSTTHWSLVSANPASANRQETTPAINRLMEGRTQTKLPTATPNFAAEMWEGLYAPTASLTESGHKAPPTPLNPATLPHNYI